MNKGKEGTTQADRRDKAIAWHCQSGEAINKSVTTERKRERAKERGSGV